MGPRRAVLAYLRSSPGSGGSLTAAARVSGRGRKSAQPDNVTDMDAPIRASRSPHPTPRLPAAGAPAGHPSAGIPARDRHRRLDLPGERDMPAPLPLGGRGWGRRALERPGGRRCVELMFACCPRSRGVCTPATFSRSHHDTTGPGLPIVRDLAGACGGTPRLARGTGPGLDARIHLRPAAQHPGLLASCSRWCRLSGSRLRRPRAGPVCRRRGAGHAVREESRPRLSGAGCARGRRR